MNMTPRPVIKEMIESISWFYNSLVTSVQGMLITGGYFVKPDEIITVRYPRVKLNVPENYRGKLINDPDRCISCELCKRACPTGCITIVHEMGADKKRILKDYYIDMTICLYCGLCTEACPDTTKNKEGKKCLIFLNDYEYSSTAKEKIGYKFKITDEELNKKRRLAAESAKKAEALKKAAEAAKTNNAEKTVTTAPQPNIKNGEK